MLYARKSAFVVDRSAPVIFQNPVLDGQILVFVDEMGVFTNEWISGSLIVTNTGSGVGIGSIGENTISLKSIVGGSNITVTDGGSYVSINNDSTVIAATISAMNALSASSDNGRSCLVLDTDGQGTVGLYIFNGTWISVASGGGGSSPVNLIHDAFDYTSSVVSLISLPPNAVVMNVQVAISTPFNGSTSTVSVGKSSDHNFLMDVSEVDTTQVKSFIDDTMTVITGSGATQFNAYVTPAGATQGVGEIFVLYSLV